MVLDTKKLSIKNPRTRAQTVAPKDNLRDTSPPLENEFGQSSMPKPMYPPQSDSTTVSSYPYPQPIVEEVVAVKLVENLASAPPPSINPGQENLPLPTSQQDLPPLTGNQDTSLLTGHQDVTPPTGQREELDSPVTNQHPYGNPHPSALPVGSTHQSNYLQPTPAAPSGGSQYPLSAGYPQPTNYHPHGYPQSGL